MKKLLFYSVVLISALSCDVVIPLEIPDQKKLLVVNSHFSKDTTFSIFVSHSVSSLGTEQPKFLEGADVKLYQDGIALNDLITDTFTTWDNFTGNEIKRPYYRTRTTKPQAGKEYKVEVAHEGYDPVQAKEVYPEASNIALKNIIRKEQRDQWGDDYAKIVFTIDDDQSEENYYSLTIVTRSSFQEFGFEHTTRSDQFYSRDIRLKENVQREIGEDEGVLGTYFYRPARFGDKLMTGNSTELELYLFDGLLDQGPDATVYMVLVTHSKADHFYKLYSERQQENGGSPFAEPVQVYNNIESGLGVFSGANYELIKLN